MSLTAKQKKRSVKIFFNKTNPQYAHSVVEDYLKRQYGGRYEDIQTKQLSNGRCLLWVILKGKDISAQLCNDNPHHAGKLKFIAEPYSGSSATSNVPAANLPGSSGLRTGGTEAEKLGSLIPYMGQLPSLVSQMEYAYDSLSLSLDDLKYREDFISNLEKTFFVALRGTASLCILYPFGSSVNRLGMKNCDLDLVLLTNGNAQSQWTGRLPDHRILISHLKKLLYREQHAFGITNIVPIASARIPIIKFKHVPTGINCDVSFNRRLGILNSKLISTIMSFSLSAKLLTFSIRLWAKQKNFCGGGGAKLNSYTVTLLVIFYLQRVSVLPPLSMLKHPGNTVYDEREGESFCVELEDFSDFEGRMARISEDQLLRGFIEYYIRFPFESNIVSVFHGVPIAVEDSPEFNAKIINVQDPFELHYNTAKGVQPQIKSWFRKCLCEAWTNRDLLLSPSDSGRPWGLQYMFQPADKASRTQSKHHHKDMPADTLITLYIPEHIREKPTVTYIKVCAKVVSVLRETYDMSVTVPPSDHPLYSRLSQFNSSLQDAECVDLTEDAPESHSSATDDVPSSSINSKPAAGQIPIQQYIPYTIQVKTRFHLKDCSMLHPDVFNYSDYLMAMANRPRGSNPSQSSEFTISFQPHDASFDQVDLELNDLSTAHIESIRQHLSTVLPHKIQHIF